MHVRRPLLIVLTLSLLGVLSLLGAGCDESDAEPDGAGELVQARIPEDDPGPPFYARVTPVFNEFFRDGEWLAIPFYRDPECVPPEFNLLSFYDFPSEAGPGAFGCAIEMTGTVYTERDAAPNSFPARVSMTGTGAVPVWFVPWVEIEAAIADEVLTLAELRSLDPLIGSASLFEESLQPRSENHRIEIESRGTLEDGRAFSFDLLHVGDTTERISIVLGERRSE